MTPRGTSTFRRFFRRREHPLSIALFRIVFSLGLLGEVLQLVHFRHLLFDEVPFAQPSRISSGPILLLWAIALIFLAAGFFTRQAAIANYILAVIILGFTVSKWGFGYHADSYYLAGSLFLSFAPAERALSIDRLLAERRKTNLPLRVSRFYRLTLLLILATVYLDSFGWKIASPMWRAGLGLWAPAMHPMFPARDWSVLLDHEVLARGAGYAALLFEGAFPFFVWIPALTVPLIAAAIVMHVAIAAVFPIPLFSLTVIAFCIGAMPPHVLRKRFRRLLRCRSAGNVVTNHDDRVPGITMFAVWLVLSCFVALQNPLSRLRVEQSPTYQRLSVILYGFTGAQPHSVFNDAYFEDKTRGYLLLWNATGTQEPLPLIARDGLPSGRYLSGRIYCLWTWYPGFSQEPAASLEATILRFVSFWAARERKDFHRGYVSIQERPMDLSLRGWKKGWMAHNRRFEWVEVGRVVRQGSHLAVAWNSKP